MALRRSSGSILKVGSSRRRSRGAGGSFDIPKPRLYDMEYRQMTEDYRDEIISFDEYISFLENKLTGLGEGTHDHFTISKRIKDITTAYNKKAESKYQADVSLQDRKLAEDYRDGLLGYAVYSDFLGQRLEMLEPESLEYFTTQKKLDDITFQHIDKQMDFGFRVSKNIEPDDYISWKEQQLASTDPNSNTYMQLQTDIKNAKSEKVNREKTSLEFDILMETKNKEDLAKFYLDTANGTDDTESQMKYYSLYSKTVDGINADILKQERDARALDEKEMRLKFNRGDLGNTYEENISAYHSFLAGQYESEFDPSRQMSYMGQLDSLTKQYEDYQEGLIKKGDAASVAYSKKLTDQFYDDRKEVNKQINILKKELNTGNLTSEEYAQQMMELFLGEDGYLGALNNIIMDPNLSEGVFEKLETEFTTIQEKFDTEGFWKANMPVPDDDGNWSGKFFTNPNYKAVQDFDNAGNLKTTWKFDPTQSYDYKDHIWDAEAQVWRKIKTVKSKNEKGEKIITKEIYRLGESGEIVKETYNDETKQWGSVGEEGFISSERRYRDVNTGVMHEFAKQEYIQKKGKEAEEEIWQDVAAKEGKPSAMIQRHMITRPEAGISKLADIGGKIKKLPEIAGDIIDKTREDFSSQKFKELPRDIGIIADIAKKGIEMKIGDRGDVVKNLQKDLQKVGVFTKQATGYFGPTTQQAVKKIQERVTSDFNIQTAKDLPRDIGVVSRAIGSAAKKMFAPQQIGGALGDVYAKRTDLQKVFDPTGKGKGDWAGKTIQDWAKKYGVKEEATLKSFVDKPKFQMPKFELPSWTKPILKPFQSAKKDISQAYSKETFGRLGKDIQTVKKATGSWLNKLKWW